MFLMPGIYLAGLIHDIGKISIPSDLLSWPGKLTKEQFSLIKTHPAVGYDIIKDVEFSQPVAEIVYQHHERLDGSGYPRELKDKEMIIGAKILAVADVVEAISSHRPYRPALGINLALDEINKNSHKFYDPKVVESCTRLFNNNQFQFINQ